MLADVRAYLRERPLASLQDIALHLKVPPEVAQELCAVWVRKGRAERIDCASGCANCQLCQGPPAELYRWRD
ncbi:FeoC-like transcriptional regulator [Thiorhodovibrio frisius]|uniref:FeoC like transcriptional regulator n=1 Tax=Thiorhodovibrio frisius TaxID=631362 RepID=H8Z7L0_9GAMM|nr:FeoC-like transcriptional regulator [Thiorhodovibrio frisius]EIC19863.1 FeoC like transcriptional regulator [Thiorhodovibrio frisius]WPL20591.1 FeoC like transcriptional regulator [Thiorhodovibrio frisius]